MKYPLYIITGAPGSGKSTTLEAFLKLHTDYIAFDIDWLADAASLLAGKNIYTDSSTWKPYGVVWFEVLHSIYKNHQTPLFFTPTDPQDIEQHGRPTWCGDIHWMLLDCNNQTRRTRLAQRADWTEVMVEEAIADAYILREAIPLRLDTGHLPPNKVAKKIVDWLKNPEETVTKLSTKQT